MQRSVFILCNLDFKQTTNKNFLGSLVSYDLKRFYILTKWIFSPLKYSSVFHITVRKTAKCDFDDSVCDFVVDYTKTLQWKRYKGDTGGGPSNKRPTFDHTKMSSQ